MQVNVSVRNVLGEGDSEEFAVHALIVFRSC